ncbi:hypothetical protein NXH64_06210 [Butyrivibrio fibrisolvens]|uniref:HAD family hydrolase n=1 Tax=Pseudobutyrivibrio ruminis TaxID=46206 RepID=UPI0004243EC4|nr:HAD family hydrolase [Pseudobutyrivibrio ruminis]MDC7279099.1 hypothetical protein [Butyrivibrio fibrisolvens]
MALMQNWKITSDKIALYGLGTETERLISQWGGGPKIIGLLDGFREEGELYGYPIISLQQAVEAGVQQILVVARPGSCKVIAKRIGEVCRENGISVYDVRGNDLLEEKEAKFDFSGINVYTKQSLLAAIDDVDVASFDLFDTLIVRKVLYYTDIFQLVESRLKANGIVIDDFASKRIAAEKELSVGAAPKLSDIYERLLAEESVKEITDGELAELEWEIDSSLFIPRDGMLEVIKYAKDSGKKVVVTTDCYYAKSQLVEMLRRFDLDVFDEIFVSSEYGKSKADGLFGVVKDQFTGKRILHTGDDEYVDVEKAAEAGVDDYRIYGAKDLYDAVGCLGLAGCGDSFADKVKIGLLLSKLFNNPFLFEEEDKRIKIEDAKNIGYFICGPMILDFAFWFREKVQKNEMVNVLLCARDGYLMEKIFERLSLDVQGRVVYFLTSRTAAIRAGIDSQEDLDYVDSMKFFGTDDENLSIRFGISLEPGEDRSQAILNKSLVQKRNYKKYIDNLNLLSGRSTVFDFVAKGTTQLFLKKLMTQELYGMYFLQLEPEFMSDKGLNIESFYTEAERDKSVIFDNYYILETILTSPMPSVDEFDEQGNPVYASETRSKENLLCVQRMQEGILEYVDDYLSIVPEEQRVINKQLDEAMLSLVGKLEITDSKFRKLVVEDPFFGRMTKMVDVL